MSDIKEAVIHVIDDDASMRTALNRLLTSAGYMVRTYTSAGEFLVSDAEERAGCLLLDLELGGPSGLELQQTLLRHGHALPIVFMSAYRDVPRTVKAMKAGATDFLLKPFDRQTLLEALDTALDAPLLQRAGPIERPHLDEREQAVLRGIKSGMRNKQIAAELKLSERTIKTARAELMRKFGAHSLAELLQLAEKGGASFVQRREKEPFADLRHAPN